MDQLFNFNGKSFFMEDRWLHSPKLNLFTDASGAIGFGAIFGPHWCYGKWPTNSPVGSYLESRLTLIIAVAR